MFALLKQAFINDTVLPDTAFKLFMNAIDALVAERNDEETVDADRLRTEALVMQQFVMERDTGV